MNEPCASGFNLGAVRGFCPAVLMLVRSGGWLRMLWLALTFAATAHAQAGVNLSWDASPQPGVVHYKIYYGTGSYHYTQTLTVGSVTSATIEELMEGVTYYFAVTAISALGEESDFSNEAIYVVPRTGPAELRTTLLADGGTRLSGLGESGHSYEIQATTDYVTWTPLVVRSANASGAFEFLDYSPPTFPVRVYRLQALGAVALPASQLQIHVAGNKVVTLTGTGQAGNSYEIQATSSLTTWTTLGSRSADDNGVFVFNDTGAPNFPSRFYRLKNLGYVVSAPAQLRISTSPDRVVNLSGTGQIGHTYEILASTDLVTWMSIGSEMADGSGTFAFTDFEAPNLPTRFYRSLDSQP